MQYILAVDPGTDKCGVALVQVDGTTELQKVVPAHQLTQEIVDLSNAYDVQALVVGDRTGSRAFVKSLRSQNPELINKLVKVDEHRTSDEARKRYFEARNLQGWRRLVPTSFQVPPEPYDDWVAVILAERYIVEHAEQLHKS